MKKQNGYEYYDKEGLLSLPAESEGGRRLYTDKDLAALHQIISLKSLGFSLDDIKQRLISLETPADAANAFTEQADDIRKKIEPCRSGYFKKGQEFIVGDLGPPLCHELWNNIYPLVYALLNGAELDYGNGRAKMFDAKCPDESRVSIHGEIIED